MKIFVFRSGLLASKTKILYIKNVFAEINYVTHKSVVPVFYSG